MERAARLLPDDAEAHSNLGAVLKNQGRLVEAVASYRRAMEIAPGVAALHSTLGNILASLGQPEEAVASHQRALAIEPNYAEGHNNLGTAQKGLGKLDDAVASYQKALALNPDFAEAHCNLGNALYFLKQHDLAMACCRRALEIKPNLAEAHNNLANILRALRQLNHAEAACRSALAISPRFAEAHCNLGMVLKDLGQIDLALASFCRALEIDPELAEAQSHLDIILFDLGQIDEPVANCRVAGQSNPSAAVLRQKRPLSHSITLVAIDTDPVSHTLTHFAVQRSLLGLEIDDVIFFGGRPLGLGERFVETQRFDSIDTYSEFVFKCLWPFVRTDQVMIVHWDGFIANPDRWQAEFLAYDYIGAPWTWASDEHKVGNGGFSIRSRRLLHTCKDVRVRRHPKLPYGGAEDIVIGRLYRKAFENLGLRFAPVELAHAFSYETGEITRIPFGFHGPANMPLFVPEKYLLDLAPALVQKIRPGPLLDEFKRQCTLRGYGDMLAAVDAIVGQVGTATGKV